ncbi:MAG: ubiquinone/menaquinone biosynthesis methyltransferase [Dehalococcoidia bacterium]|nr:ubiquinone/menaquinone biosynthesis methyltransferase [Dehalococcoidia bacterium]
MSERGGEPASGLFEAGADRAGYVRGMFGEIAARYDLMNALITGGRHHAWRRLAARLLVRPGDRVVDVGSGTGDLALACARAGAGMVLGLDFAAPMLAHARRKAARAGAREAAFALGDATRLPLAGGSVDAWCAAFVLRNVPALDVALAEARRVLRPGGRLAVLEIPRLERGWLRPLIRLHLRYVVPLLGRVISGHASAYAYLPVSVDHFLTPLELTAALRRAGFAVTQVRVMMLGTVALHVAEVPRADGGAGGPASG